MTFYTAKQIRDIFDSFDVNKNGKIEQDEFMYGFRQLFPRFSKETIQQLFRQADKDFTKTVDYDEFVSLIRYIERKAYSFDPFIKLFDEGDKDGNGKLDRVEFVNIWKKVDPSLDTGLITELFNVADIDGNGFIDFDEYLNIIANVKAQVV